MKIRQHDHLEAGFALLEVIVAMAIMALVGLMAWRGMDAMIRGREIIDRRANDDVAYTQLVRQFDRDCQEILRSNQLNEALSVSTPPSVSSSQAVAIASSASSIASIAAGTKTIWWMRQYRADNHVAWLLVGYGMSASGLRRWTSHPLSRRSEALALWSGIVRDPDLISTDLVVSYEVPSIVRQSFSVQAANFGGLSATGAGQSATNTNATQTITAVSAIAPSQQGVQIQWWLKDAAFPLTRSCLMGGSL